MAATSQDDLYGSLSSPTAIHPWLCHVGRSCIIGLHIFISSGSLRSWNAGYLLGTGESYSLTAQHTQDS